MSKGPFGSLKTSFTHRESLIHKSRLTGQHFFISEELRTHHESNPEKLIRVIPLRASPFGVSEQKKVEFKKANNGYKTKTRQQVEKKKWEEKQVI